MEVEVWARDWSLPSVDPKCLAIMAYSRFSNAPVKFNATNNPWRSPNGNLPVLKQLDTVYTDVSDMFNHLRRNNYGCEYELNITDSADMYAFIKMVEEKLAPAVNHLFWMNSKIYSDVTRPWYGKAVKLPLSLYYPNKYRDQFQSQIYGKHPNLSEEDTDTKIYNDAKECMNHLSVKLSNSEYFFGGLPTALDAVVYGYLAPLAKAPLPVNSLTGHLKVLDNLQALIRRIQYRFFAQEIQEMAAEQEENAKETQADFEEFPNKKRNLVIAAAVAISSMIAYAMFSGLVQVELTSGDGHDDEDDDDYGE